MVAGAGGGVGRHVKVEEHILESIADISGWSTHGLSAELSFTVVSLMLRCTRAERRGKGSGAVK